MAFAGAAAMVTSSIMSLPDPLRAQLLERLGPKGFIEDQEAMAPRLVEWRGRYQGHSPALALPASLEEAQALVALCGAAGVAITPQGGNTGLVGGQIPQGEVLVAMDRMARVRAIDPVDDALTVEAGAILAHVQAAAEGAGRRFPLSLGSQGSARIGGLISTNAGGVHVVRYGMMRDLVLGLEAVLPNGAALHGLKSLRKDNTGYDLKQLLIGAEGTLGLITAATLKLVPALASHVVAMVALERPEQAIALLQLVKARTGALSAFELMNRLSVDLAVQTVPGVRDPFVIATGWLALIECETAAPGLEDLVEETLADALEQGLIVDATVARSEAAARAFWALREALPAGHRGQGEQANHDVSAPVSLVPVFLERAAAAVDRLCPGGRIVAFGHAGDGNIHYSVLQPVKAAPESFAGVALNDAIHEIAVDLGGSISAEHGIGVSRRADFLRFKPPEQVALMRAIKAALDPKGIMNPRVMMG